MDLWYFGGDLGAMRGGRGVSEEEEEEEESESDMIAKKTADVRNSQASEYFRIFAISTTSSVSLPLKPPLRPRIIYDSIAVGVV